MTVLAPTEIALKDILFATDFTPLSSAALPYAVEFARRFGATLHVMHVLLPAEWPPAMGAAPPVFSPPVAIESAEREMERFLGPANLDRVPHESKIERGTDVWATITNLVRSNQIDLLVMGTHGREGLKRFLLGSVAESVFRTVTCPVLTIGPNAARRPPRLLRRMLFATDMTAESLKAVPFVLRFADNCEARVTVLHVPAGERPTTYAERVLAAESNGKWMREAIPPQPGMDYEVMFGDPAQAILNAAENRDCDLIVLGAHPGRGLSTHLPGAIAHEVVAEAYCPVLVVHGNLAAR